MKLLNIKFAAILLTYMLIGCGSQGEDKNNKALTKKIEIQQEQAVVNVEKFTTFYERFISDESFQMTRIKHPLKGYSIEGDEKILWTKENIRIQKGSIFEVDTNKFKIEIIETDTTFFTRVYKDDSEVDIQNKFELIDEKWYLTFHLNIY